MDNRLTALDRAEPGEARDVVGRPRPSRWKRVLFFSLMAVLLVVVFGGLWEFNKFRNGVTAQFLANMKPPPAAVALVEAKAQPMPLYLPGIGSLWAVHQVSVAPEIGGRVTQIFFEPGAAVKAGDPLIQLNDQPEQGDLLNYKAQARLAEANLKRAAQLASRQYETQVNVDTWQAQLDQANAGIAKTQALIGEKLVRAPFGGVLGTRQVDLGQYLNAGTTIVTLTDLDTLWVNFTLPEQSNAQLALGQKVEITVDAYADRVFKATLTTIEPQVGSDTRTIKLQATLKNPERLLKPGMFAHARIVLPPQPDVVTVPETAIDYSLYGNSVFLVREDGVDKDGKPVLKAKRTPVTVGSRFDNVVAILSGLKAGDRVVKAGQVKLFGDGATVVPATSDALATPSKIPTN